MALHQLQSNSMLGCLLLMISRCPNQRTLTQCLSNPGHQEAFGHGSLFAVKELRIVRGERRDITFHAEARLDGLMRREETFGLKLTEYFSGRDDHLTYRSATFGAGAAGGMTGDAAAGGSPNGQGGAGSQPEAMIPPQPLQSAAGYGLPGGQLQQQSQVRALPVLKIAQKFSRNQAKPADQDVAKQVFHIAVGKMIVQFHHADDRLVAGHLVFHSDGPVQAVQVGVHGLGLTNQSLSCSTVKFLYMACSVNVCFFDLDHHKSSFKVSNNSLQGANMLGDEREPTWRCPLSAPNC
jgi:hypothetical protein